MTSTLDRLKNSLERLHLRVFGIPLSGIMAKFLKNLSWSFIGVIGSAGVLFIVSIVGARVLGPEEYGKYSLAITIANILGVLCALGFDQAAVKYMSEKVDAPQKGDKYYSTSLLVTGIFCGIVSLLLFTGRATISRLMGVEGVILAAAAGYALVIALRQSCEVFLRGRFLFKAQAAIKINEAIVTVLLLLAVMYFVRTLSFTWYLGVLGATSILSFVICFLLYFRHIQLKLHLPLFREMKTYAFSGLYISFIGMITLNIDRFFLNKSLGSAEVGIYSAYMLVPTMLATYFATAVVNVLFPTITQLPDKKAILKKIERIGLLMALPIILSYFIFGFAVLSLLGQQYRLDLGYLALTSVYGFLLVYVAVLATVIGSSQHTYSKYARIIPTKLAAVIICYVILSSLHLIIIPALILVLIFAVLIDITLFHRVARYLQ